MKTGRGKDVTGKTLAGLIQYVGTFPVRNT
jgi:hypothetical protein